MLGLGAKRKQRERAFALYARAVARAREPVFYDALGVPDSVDGRFEMIALHVYLLLRRLRAEDAAAAELSQALFDAMFADMDRSLREMGIGDLSVGKRVKAMARGFYGRIKAYDDGLAAAEPEALGEALRRNLFGTGEAGTDQIAAMAAYLRRAAETLAGQDGAAVIGAEPDFGPLPG